MRSKGVAGGILLLGLLVLLLLGSPAARADDVEDALEKAEQTLVRKLWSTIEWAKGKKITGWRHRLCRVILTIDPDHFRARKLLKYHRKSKKDPWVQDSAYSEPPDWNVGNIPKAEARMKGAKEAYRDAVLAILEGAPELDPGRAERVYERLVDLLPTDPVLLESRGFVEHEGRWVLPETITGEKTRRDRRAFVALSLDKVKARIRRDPAASKLGGTSGFLTDRRLVYGTVDPRFSLQALVNMELGDLLGAQLFGAQKRVPGPEVSILLNNRREAREHARRKRESESTLKDIEDVSALWLDSGEYMAYWTDESYRVLGGLRGVIDSYLDRTFRGHKRGWITEGIGQRLTYTVTRQHGANYVSLSATERYQDEDEDADFLPDEPSAWPHAAAKVLERDGPKRLAAVLTMRLNAMKAGDVLVAYGLAAYLLEARPDLFLSFVKTSAEKNDANAICEEALGADVATVAWRIRRWLLQVR